SDSDRDCQWVVAEDGGYMKGVGVWRLDRATRRAFLCELIGDMSAISDILDAVLYAAWRQKARAIDFGSNDARFVPRLKSQWFMRRPGHHCHIKSFVDRSFPADIRSADAWHITGGDMDFY